MKKSLSLILAVVLTLSVLMLAPVSAQASVDVGGNINSS
jgi:hypothetical protein